MGECSKWTYEAMIFKKYRWLKQSAQNEKFGTRNKASIQNQTEKND